MKESQTQKCIVYGLFQLRLSRPLCWCDFDNVFKSFVSSYTGNELIWLIGLDTFFICSSYSVIFVLNAFQAAEEYTVSKTDSVCIEL